MKQTRVLRFLRRNAAYMILALCVLAIGLSITLVMISRNAETARQIASREQTQTVDTVTDNTQTVNEPVTDDPIDTPVDVTPTDPTDTDVPVVKVITFIMPVANATAIEDYTDTLAYNATLKRYQAHKAMDIFAEEGAAVFAAYDGVVSDVTTTLLTGTTITIDHGNGLYTVYNSLADGDGVFVGQAVSQGAKIGEVSLSNRQEAAEGAHLHFQTIENGEAINPAKYLIMDEK